MLLFRRFFFCLFFILFVYFFIFTSKLGKRPSVSFLSLIVPARQTWSDKVTPKGSHFWQGA